MPSSERKMGRAEEGQESMSTGNGQKVADRSHPLVAEPQLEESEPAKQEPEEQPAHARQRLTSLDAFRGLTILLMLLVNNIALDVFTPAQLVHAPWNETPRLADYVFPWFLLCIGLSLPFSAKSAKDKGKPRWQLELRIILRASALILLGCILESAAEKKPVFSMGVLQLLGFAYLAGAWLYELPALRRAVVAGFLLLGYGFALKFMPNPGSSIGNLTESGNLVNTINRMFMGSFNLEGVSSAIPTGALVVIGSIMGDAILAFRDKPLQLLARLVISGVGLLVIGLIAGVWIPFNKAIWTPSFILLAGGAGVLVLALFHLTTDAIAKRNWAMPPVVFGSNAIVAYFVPILVKLTMLQVWMVNTSKGKMSLIDGTLAWFVDHFGRIAGGWSYTIFYIGVWWLVLYAMYRKKMFLRV